MGLVGVQVVVLGVWVEGIIGAVHARRVGAALELRGSPFDGSRRVAEAIIGSIGASRGVG
jgi:hypothetical protein